MLTDAQKTDVRRYAGYPLLADVVANASADAARGWVSPGTYQTLAYRLDNLRPSEETVLTGYLTTLGALETAVTGAGANLDTDQAAVWKRNRNEVQDRTRLFDEWRRRMCGFLGVAPGPALMTGAGTATILRG